MYKKCLHCKEWKDVSYFHKNKSTEDGFQDFCIECSKITKLERKNRPKKPIPKEGYRFCTKCGEEKLIEEFRGKRNQCKCCEQEYRDNNRDILNEWYIHNGKTVNDIRKFEWAIERSLLPQKYVPPEGFKVCTKCKQEKLLSEFYRASCNKDGYDHNCKECCKQYALFIYPRMAERIKQKDKERYCANKNYYQEYNKRYWKKQISEYDENDTSECECSICHEIKQRIYFRKCRNVCLDCAKAKRQKWYYENFDSISEKAHGYNHSFSGIIASVKKAYNRRVAFERCFNDLNKNDIENIFQQQNNKCTDCGCELTQKTLTIDHIVPLNPAKVVGIEVWSGYHSKSNIQCLCKSCNCSKGNRYNLLTARKVLVDVLAVLIEKKKDL